MTDVHDRLACVAQAGSAVLDHDPQATPKSSMRPHRPGLSAALFALGLLLASACSGPASGPPPIAPATGIPTALPVPAATVTLSVARAAAPSPALSVASTPAPPATGDITVFAATSLTDVMAAMATGFAAGSPDAHLIFIYANSATLAGELEQGAKADVFASAHPSTMARVGAIVGLTQVFARTSLVLVTPLNNPANLTTVKDLGNPGVRVVTSDPSDAVALYTQSMLMKASVDPLYGSDFADRVQRNVASQKTTQRDMLEAVLNGTADAAVAYVSDLTPDRRSRLNAIALPDALNTPVTDPIALARGDNPSGGQAFIKFVLSEAGQDIVVRHGFTKAGA